MARIKFDTSMATMDKGELVLVYGAYAAGKTHLQGDFLRWAKERDGGKVRFLNIAGEDGYTSIAGMGLGEVGETVTTLDDFNEALEEYSKDGLSGLAIDGLTAFYAMCLVNVVGSHRYPDPKLDGERAKMLWGQISMKCKGGVLASRKAAKHVLWVSPFDRSEDVTGGKGLTPDLSGKNAWGCGGWFDFVGTLTSEIKGPGVVQRAVSFAPALGVLTRQRAPRAILKPIPIPNDKGGWENIYKAMSEAFNTTTPSKETTK